MVSLTQCFERDSHESGKSLFQLIAEQIIGASAQFDAHVPWYIMTSEENDAATRALGPAYFKGSLGVGSLNDAV